jgi:aerobic-type carbon monoxide dehydrogenase small subunit (CoxS/CutS family)
MKARLTVNGRDVSVDADDDTPLLWILRDELRLTGTKFGCGAGICGACTVLQGNAAVRSCQIPLSDAAGKRFTTIEGLENDRCQRAWLAEDVAQCGYCQSGMIMEACALLARTPKPSDGDIDAVMRDHVCRCGTYVRIRAAIHTASRSAK